MRKPILIIAFILFSVSLYAQNIQVTDSTANYVIQQSENTFPKFYREFQYIRTHDSLIKNIVFIEKGGIGPAFASPKGLITINLDYIKNRKPNFDDNRLIVVLYHEVGHLHYYVITDRSKWNPEYSEKAAFEYSLLKTKELAEHNDCMPLKTGLKFMKLRSEGNNLQDAHVRALKRMVNEPLYKGYVDYVNVHCN